MTQHIIYTPPNIFADVNFGLDTQTVVINESAAKGVLFKEIYFAAREVFDKRPRGYGVLAQSENKKDAPLLVIIGDYYHGIDIDIMLYYAGMGFSVFMFDYSGEGFGKTKYTFYTPETDYANYLRAGRRLNYADTNARETCYFEWSTLAHYAVTAAIGLFDNKPAKTGVLGVGTGANIAWMLAYADKRITACCNIFAAGWDVYKDKFKYGSNDLNEISEERERWLAGLSAETYAKYINIPIMLLTASNNKYTHIERAYDTMARIPDARNSFICIAPNSDGYICHYGNIRLFFEKYLLDKDITMPQKAQLGIDNTENTVALKVECGNMDDVKDINIYCSENQLNPISRAWFTYNAYKSQGVAIPKLHANDGLLFAYANITYNSGLVLSTNLCVKNKGELSRTNSIIKRSNLIYDSKMGLDCFTVFSREKPLLKDLHKDCKITLKKGPENILGICASSLATYKVGAAGCNGTEDESFKFDIYSASEQELTIYFLDKQGLDTQDYHCTTVKLKGGSIWQPVEIKKQNLKTKDGIILKSWEDVIMAAFTAEKEFLINNILWI